MMVFKHLKTGFRILKKQQLPSVINLLGLSLAIGCCYVVFSLFDLGYNADTGHPNRDRIFVVERLLENNGRPEHWADSPAPLGPVLKNDLSIVENMCRLTNLRSIVRSEEQVFSERVTFMDASVFEMFSFPMKMGSAMEFQSANALILSEAMAYKYFGNQNPLGKIIHLRFDVQGKKRDFHLEVKAIAQKQRNNNTFDFDILVPYQLLSGPEAQTEGGWQQLADVTFVQLRDVADIKALRNALGKYVPTCNEGQKGLLIQAFYLAPLRGIAARSEKAHNKTLSSVHPDVLLMLGLLALFLLALVCFNFINLAMATATVRLKEISVRKVLGGSRRQLALQFLTENALLCALALGVGLFFGAGFLLPHFNQMMKTTLEVDFYRPEIWEFIGGLFVFVTLASAGYPAMYIAGFQPIEIIRNKVKLGEKSRMRRVLVGFQFALTFMVLFIALAFLRENQHIQRIDWGYSPEDVLVVRLNESSQFLPLKNALVQLPGVVSVAGGAQLPNVGYEPVLVEAEGQKIQVKQLGMGAGMIETLGIPVWQGNGFFEELVGGQRAGVLVNEVFRQQMKWETVMGKTLEINGETFPVVGGTGDFRVDFFDDAIPPVVLVQTQMKQSRYLSVKAAPGRLEQVTEAARLQWQQLYPNDFFDFFHQQRIYEEDFSDLNNFNKLLFFSSFLSILIAVFGLFGISMLTLSQRMKEFSMRKILGANAWHIAVAINREFVVLLLVTLAIAAPLSWWAVDGLVHLISSAPLPVHFVTPLAAGACILLAVVLALSVQYFRVLATNPARNLRSE